MTLRAFDDVVFGVYVIAFLVTAAQVTAQLWHSDPFLCSTVLPLCSQLSLPPRMIRRNPTLIAMSDADVQDVRNMLAKKQAEGVKSPNSSANVKSRQCPPPQPPAAAVHVTDEAKRRREAREERLGVTN
jgi:hypothetical protein